MDINRCRESAPSDLRFHTCFHSYTASLSTSTQDSRPPAGEVESRFLPTSQNQTLVAPSPEPETVHCTPSQRQMAVPHPSPHPGNQLQGEGGDLLRVCGQKGKAKVTTFAMGWSHIIVVGSLESPPNGNLYSSHGCLAPAGPSLRAFQCSASGQQGWRDAAPSGNATASNTKTIWCYCSDCCGEMKLTPLKLLIPVAKRENIHFPITFLTLQEKTL